MALLPAVTASLFPCEDAEQRVPFTDIKQTTEVLGFFKLTLWISCAVFLFLVFLILFFFLSTVKTQEEKQKEREFRNKTTIEGKGK